MHEGVQVRGTRELRVWRLTVDCFGFVVLASGFKDLETEGAEWGPQAGSTITAFLPCMKQGQRFQMNCFEGGLDSDENADAKDDRHCTSRHTVKEQFQLRW